VSELPLNFDRPVTFMTLVAVILATMFSAYQTMLMRMSMDLFRSSNRNERLIDACVEYITRARDFQGIVENWATSVIQDKPRIANALAAEEYSKLAVRAGLDLSESESKLLILGGKEFESPLSVARSVTTAVFVMSDNGGPSDRGSADLWIRDLDVSLSEVENNCKLEIGVMK